MQHCDTNHYKAEIIFELPSGGKEDRIVSFKPPVIVERASGYYGKIVSQRHFYGGGEETPYKMIEKIIGKMFVKKEHQGNDWLYQNSGDRWVHRYELDYIQPPNSSVLYSVRVFEKDNTTGIEKHIYTSPWDAFNTTSDFFQILFYVNNGLIVYDTTGLIHVTQANSYRVECFGCPGGEVAISKDGGEEFICIDKNRVINEIGNIRSKAISIMKYLNL